MPRSSAVQMELTKARLTEAAARGFRLSGFAGLGIDAVAKEAGVTSGAFYTHFGSKFDAFRDVLRRGFDDVVAGFRTFRATAKDRWPERLAKWYLSPQRRADVGGSCVLATLTLEAARADASTRADYEGRLRELVATMTVPGPERLSEAEALALIAILAGGLSIAHAVDDAKLGAKIERAVCAAVPRILDRSRRSGDRDTANP